MLMTNLTLEEKIQSIINSNSTSGNNAGESIMGQMPPIPSATTNASPKKSNAVLPARLDFVHVFEPWAFNGNDTPKYSVTLIISKDDTDTIRKIHNAIIQAYENGQSKLQAKFKDIRNPLHDGDIERPNNPVYKNCWFINATNNGKFGAPAVCDKNAQAITDKKELYSGVWGKVHVSFAAYCGGSDQSQKGIGCYLKAVQKIRDDERLVNPFAIFMLE